MLLVAVYGVSGGENLGLQHREGGGGVKRRGDREGWREAIKTNAPVSASHSRAESGPAPPPGQCSSVHVSKSRLAFSDRDGVPAFPKVSVGVTKPFHHPWEIQTLLQRMTSPSGCRLTFHPADEELRFSLSFASLSFRLSPSRLLIFFSPPPVRNHNITFTKSPLNPFLFSNAPR